MSEGKTPNDIDRKGKADEETKLSLCEYTQVEDK